MFGISFEDTDHAGIVSYFDGGAKQVRQRREIVFVDNAVSDHESLLRALDPSDSTRSLEVIWLDPASDGLAQVTTALAMRTGIDAVHILSHGQKGGFTIGTTLVDEGEALRHAAELGTWRAALRPEADLLIYGCRTAQGSEGKRLLRTLADLTGADVAGSEHLIGNLRSGGDWVLGVRVGRIETREAVSKAGREAWPGLLAVLGYDSFTYGVGPLPPNNGGTGWAGAWGAGNVQVVAAGLTDPSATLAVSGGTTQLSMPLDTVRDTTIAVRNLTPNIGADGTTTWFSILLKPGTTASSDDYAGVNLGTGFFSRFFFGYSAGSLLVETYGLGGTSSLTAPATPGQTVFLVLKVDFVAGSDTATLYYNPTPGLGAPDSTDIAIKSDLNINGGSTFTQLAIAGGQAANSVNSGQLDEIRVGDSYADVAPGLCPGGVVTTTADSATGGSLRACIIWANVNPGADTITLPAGNYVLSIAGSDDISERGDLDITGSVTISGAGASSSTIDANGLDRVFDVRSGVVNISGVTISGGNISNKGGGIRNVANLTLSDSIVASNNAIEGGGIYEEGIGATLVLDNVTLVLNTADTGAGIRIVTDGASATLTDVTLDRNVATNNGGGMSVEQADASLNGVTFVNNDADTGAGLWTKATTCDVNLTNVTFSGNDSTGEGGGIWAEGNSLTLDNVTLAGNTAIVKGGGIRPKAGTVTLSNTIISGNTPDNCERAVTSGGGNVESPGNSCALTDPTDQPGVSVTDMNIGPLADNGGPTKTHALITGSFAVDAGIGCPPPATDQRGVARPDGAACDSGAFEGALPLPTISGSVYHDVNANSTFDAGESGIGDAWIKLVSGGSVVQVVAADPDSGAYAITGVVDGSYEVIVDDNNNAGDSTPTAPVNWVFQNPAAGTLNVNVSGADVADQDLGLTFNFDLAADCSCGYQDGLFTQVPITVDGNMGDWATVFSDGDNNACDATDDTDLDHPVQSTGRNLLRTAVTWDATYFSMWTQRVGSSNNTQNFVYYADINADGILQNGEPVVAAKWQGNSGVVTLELYSYDAMGSGGDPVLDSNGFADGYSMPGDLTFVKTLTMPDGAGQGSTTGNTDGTQMEWNIEWSELGVPAGSAIGWHVSSTNSNPGAAGLGAQIDDNLGGCGGQCTGSNQFAGITPTPIAAGGGGIVYAAHTFTNTGNGTDLFDFAWIWTGDFAPASVTFYRDLGTVGEYDPGVDVLLTDTDGDSDPDTGNLAAGASFELLIAIELPGPPAAGVATVTTIATSNFVPGCGGTVTPVNGSVNDPLRIASEIVKRAFQVGGTPIADVSTLPMGLLVKFLIYFANYGAVLTDVSLRDVLDPAFQYQAGTMKVDNALVVSVVCPAHVCDEAAIFAQVDGSGTAVGDGDAVTVPIDADEASFDSGTRTIDLGHRNNVNNAQIDAAADSVWALVYTIRMQ